MGLRGKDKKVAPIEIRAGAPVPEEAAAEEIAAAAAAEGVKFGEDAAAEAEASAGKVETVPRTPEEEAAAIAHYLSVLNFEKLGIGPTEDAGDLDINALLEKVWVLTVDEQRALLEIRAILES